jgi:3-oxoacyl-[acyl-carrier protein] reductase
MRLEGKIAIVTGGGRGIGRAICLGFAREGAMVVVAARSIDQINSVANEICDQGGKAVPIECDVANEDMVKALVARTISELGRVHVLVNNAGIGTARPVWGLTRRAFEEVIQVNLVGSFLCTKHVWHPMREAGGGSIINVASLAGTIGYPMLSAYCASKWGQIGLNKSCAE